MWARVKMRGISIDIEGAIPGPILEILRLEYGPRLRVTTSGFERMRDVLNAPLYKTETLAMNPRAYLKFYRQDNYLTQAELGRMLGDVQPQIISNMENGRRPISRIMALRLSRLFDVSADKFIGRA
jgi:DNA-binding XRE family transcriptional regulator